MIGATHGGPNLVAPGATSEGKEVPDEPASFKFARQRSKLAGTIRGSFFVIKGTY
jgi:hypothetical protein